MVPRIAKSTELAVVVCEREQGSSAPVRDLYHKSPIPTTHVGVSATRLVGLTAKTGGASSAIAFHSGKAHCACCNTTSQVVHFSSSQVNLSLNPSRSTFKKHFVVALLTNSKTKTICCLSAGGIPPSERKMQTVAPMMGREANPWEVHQVRQRVRIRGKREEWRPAWRAI